MHSSTELLKPFSTSTSPRKQTQDRELPICMHDNKKRKVWVTLHTTLGCRNRSQRIPLHALSYRYSIELGGESLH